VIAGYTSRLGHGGVLYANGIATTVTVANCTLYNTESYGDGGAFYVEDGADVIVENCIVWSNRITDFVYGSTGAVAYVTGSGSSIASRYACYQATNAAQVVNGDGNATVSFGEGLIFADPLFAGGTDVHLRSAAGRYVPSTGTWIGDDEHSPCIDAGDPDANEGDEPVPNGGTINMGAYGGTAEASRSIVAGSFLLIR